MLRAVKSADADADDATTQRERERTASTIEEDAAREKIETRSGRCLLSRGATALLLALGLLVLVFFFDAPFGLDWMYVNGVIAWFVITRESATAKTRYTQNKTLKSPLETLVPSTRFSIVAMMKMMALLIANYTLYAILEPFEVKDMQPVDIDAHTTFGSVLEVMRDGGTPNADLPRTIFFQMHNSALQYTASIERIMLAMNPVGNDTDTNRVLHPLVVDKLVDVWSSDVLRYEFLLAFWDYVDAAIRPKEALRDSTQTPGPSRAFAVCLLESDVVVDMEYFDRVLWERADDQVRGPELAHVQHFWGHVTFEPFNLGMLCASSESSSSTRRWTKLMDSLHRKRFRRLLPLNLLFALLPQRIVLEWDRTNGCTEYYPHCKYIHFTGPKIERIERAVETIEHAEAAIETGSL